MMVIFSWKIMYKLFRAITRMLYIKIPTPTIFQAFSNNPTFIVSLHVSWTFLFQENTAVTYFKNKELEVNFDWAVTFFCHEKKHESSSQSVIINNALWFFAVFNIYRLYAWHCVAESSIRDILTILLVMYFIWNKSNLPYSMIYKRSRYVNLHF